MTGTDSQYMQQALEAAASAREEGNDPYGAVVVREGQAIAGRNLSVTTLDPTAHSEVMAIRNACQAWRTLDLGGATMYTSFEPCPMCCGAILISGITRLVIGARRVVGEPPLGGYQVERLLDMVGRSGEFSVRSDVLADECQRFYARSGRIERDA
jgi:tRNA(Arg) A34 adenosine deaminase TadA